MSQSDEVPLEEIAPDEGSLIGNPGDDTLQDTPADEPPAGKAARRGLSPEAKKILRELDEPDEALEAVLQKDPTVWTENELAVVRKERVDRFERDRGDPVVKLLDRLEGVWHDAIYGNQPTARPNADKQIPTTPTPARAPDGADLTAAARGAIGTIFANAKNSAKNSAKNDADGGEDGGNVAPAVRGLQSGLNTLAAAEKDKNADTPRRFFNDNLKVDGVFGAKTRAGVKRAVATLGPKKVEEVAGLGRFQNFIRQTGKNPDAARLAAVTRAAFSRLNTSRTMLTGAIGEPVSALQETLNALGTAQFGRNRWKPLKADGRVGQKTTAAVGALVKAFGPEALSEEIGRKFNII